MAAAMVRLSSRPSPSPCGLCLCFSLVIPAYQLSRCGFIGVLRCVCECMCGAGVVVCTCACVCALLGTNKVPLELSLFNVPAQPT